jgi:hypothetical protein
MFFDRDRVVEVVSPPAVAVMGVWPLTAVLEMVCLRVLEGRDDSLGIRSRVARE